MIRYQGYQHTRNDSDVSATDTLETLQGLGLCGGATGGALRQDKRQLRGSYAAADLPLAPAPAEAALQSNTAQLYDQRHLSHRDMVAGILEVQSCLVGSEMDHTRASRCRAVPPAQLPASGQLPRSAGVGCGILGASAVWGMPAPLWGGQP